MIVTGKTDVGLKRSSNQDGFAHGRLGDAVWAVVCDGMGGANGGNIACEIAVKRIATVMENFDIRTLGEGTVQRAFESAIASANALIFDRAAKEPALAGMGTTAVIVLAVDKVAYVAHVGDSRCYHLQSGKLVRVTRDHSVVQSLVESGKITDEQAKTHAQKNIITRAIGVDRLVEPEFDTVALQPGDRLLLCSDGLTNFAEESAIAALLTQPETDAVPAALIEAANRGGGGDNITAVVIGC